ncbi:MAG: hypothetical protein VX938_13675, partial [Myxococcota bacterium]|nr:hypothetical protein [Myxococcota bacterium]
MTPLQWVVATRRRLWAAAIASALVAFGLAPLVSSFVRDHSRSIGDDMLALTGWCLVALGCSLCLAILAGERLFTYGWRERVFLGLDVTPPESDDPMEPPVVLKTHTGAFVFVWIFVLLTCLGTLELVTGGLFAEYQTVGRMRTLLRSDNHEMKRAMMAEIADLRTEEEVRAGLPVVDMAWRDARQPEEVQLAALRSLGRLSLSLVTSATSWRKEGVHEHWEMDILRTLRTQIVPDLRLAFDKSSGHRKALLAFALGKVRDHRSVPQLLKAARRGVEEGAHEETRAIFAALGVLHDPDALRGLVEMAPGLYDSDIQRYGEMMKGAEQALEGNPAVAPIWAELAPSDRSLVLRAWLMTGSGDESAAV